MPTIEEVRVMSDEEVAALNKVLARKLMKRIAIRAGVTVAVYVTVNHLANKYLNDTDSK